MSESSDDGMEISVEGIGGEGALSKSPTSQQLSDRRIRSIATGVKPPYNPDRLASFIELNETHATAVRKKSRYEVGFGFAITPHRDVDSDEADEQERAVARSFWRGPTSSWETGPHQSAEPTTPEEVKELARQDYHSVGYCCLELLTDMEGRPVGLAHVPANTIRVRKPQSRMDGQPRHPEDGRFVDGDVAQYASRGYVQIRDGQRRYYGEAGDRYRGLSPEITGGEEDPRVTYQPDPDSNKEPIYVDRETGDVALGSADGLDNEPANELIFIRNPSPLEQDYGVPDWVSAIRTIGGDEAAKDYNRDFFLNDTIPRFVIKVTGGELKEKSKRDLRQMLNGLREESHRAVILELDKFKSKIDEDIEIELEPLGQGISEEMDFREYRAKNEHEIAKVHEVPPILIGVTETSNRSNSREQIADFANNVIAPEQHKFAQRMYRLIHQQALGVTDWTIEYELRGAEQPAEDAKVARRKIQAVRGAIPVNRALEMVGEDPLPDDHPVDGDTLVANVGSEAGGQRLPGRTEQSRPDFLPPEDNKIGEKPWAEVEAELVAKDEIEQMQFDSSNLDEGLYDFEAQELYLSFQRDDGQSSLYAYVDVPPTEWSGLTAASSHGSYHYDSIRLDYPYIEITNFHDRLPEGPAPEPGEEPDDIPL
jgi:HK97 family phage portal protein